MKEPLQAHKLGGEQWCDQSAHGFPMLEDLAESGAYPASSVVPKVITSEELPQTAKSRVRLRRKEADSSTRKLRGESSVPVARGWLKRPRNA